MIIIKVKEGESIDRALRRYKRKHRDLGIKNTIRNRAYYQKPSAAKKEMMKKAINRQDHYAKDNY